MPRPAKTDDPRRTILAAARALVLAEGHEAVSLRAVAAKAGFSPASLYEYFEGREDLLAAVAAESARRFAAALRRAAGAATPGARLVDLGLAYVAFARRHTEDFLLLFSALGSKRRGLDDPDGGPAYGLLAGAVHEAMGPGAAAGDVEAAAYALWAAAHGMAMLQVTHLRGFRADFPAADRRALEALVRGLGLAGP